jgi:hypothetical protein
VIGPPGGSWLVETGPDTGFAFSVPAGALAAYTSLAPRPGTSVTKAGYLSTGVPIAVPDGVAFTLPVTVTVPVIVPAGKTIADLVVLQRDDGTGVVTVVTPVSRDAGASTVTVLVSSFSTFQGAVLVVAPASTTYSGSTGGGGGGVTGPPDVFRHGPDVFPWEVQEAWAPRPLSDFEDDDEGTWSPTPPTPPTPPTLPTLPTPVKLTPGTLNVIDAAVGLGVASFGHGAESPRIRNSGIVKAVAALSRLLSAALRKKPDPPA